MSIINDALKKAQKNLSKNKKNFIPPPPTIEVPNKNNSAFSSERPGEARIKEDNFKYFMLIALFLGILLFFSLIFVLLLNFFKKEIIPSNFSPRQEAQKIYSLDKKAMKTPDQRPSSLPIERRQQETSDVKKGSGDNLTLNGIMVIDKRTVALINGEDYQEGERVHGMEIMKITRKEVTLKKKTGELFILNVKP